MHTRIEPLGALVYMAHTRYCRRHTVPCRALFAARCVLSMYCVCIHIHVVAMRERAVHRIHVSRMT